jgi:hypothetical protein
MRSVRLIVLPLLLVAVLAGTACSRSPTPEALPAAQGAASGWQDFVGRFIEESFVANPFFAVDAGRHDFDGKAPDWSADGIAREIARLHAARAEAEAFPDEMLTPEERFERDYLLSVIDGELFWLDTAQFPFRNPAWYIDQLDPDPYLSREYAPLEQRMAAYTGYARAVVRLAENIRANLRTPLPKSFIERGIAGFGGFAEFYRTDVPGVFESVRDEKLRAEFAEANEAAAKAMNGLKRWLESEAAHATQDYALGAVLFGQMLERTEGVRISLEELIAAGEADLERNLQALRQACAEYLPKGTIPACIAKMNRNKPRVGTVAAATQQLEALRAFVRDTKVVSIPTDQQALVKESPPYNRGNSAYINIPGPYESKNVAWTYFVAPPDPSWSAKEREEYIPGVADLMFTSVHEVWPGHFLQFQHSTRNPSRVASLWSGYAFAEGWAHYAEELMWEIGLGNGDPELRVGQLTNALLRNVRFLSAIGLHTQGMTIAESERLFREKAFTDAATARQQAARGTYDPAYLNYTLGKLMILKLRRDWMALNPPGPGIDPDSPERYRAFHDKLLSYGAPTVPLVRREMLGGSEDAGSLL